VKRRLLPLVPLALLLLGAIFAIVLSEGAPGRLTPELAWAPPGAGRILGSGEGGIDLGLALAHAELRGAVLAALVSLLGFVVGVPLGCAAALYQGRFERVVVRICDLLQAFPSFLLAVAVQIVKSLDARGGFLTDAQDVGAENPQGWRACGFALRPERIAEAAGSPT
jgi:peptide/nickel transport system permease protein